MQFTGQITQVTEQSGTNKYGEQYHGVNLTVVEPKTDPNIYNNKATLYVKDGTAQQYQVGQTVTVEARLDIETARTGSGRLYNTVNCSLVTPESF